MDREKFDKICITDLLLRCVIGLNDWERTQKQDVLINITLYADLRLPCQNDRINDSIDYKEIKKQIVTTVESSSFYLVERLAGSIAQICLTHPVVKAVTIRVEKPGALRYAKSVGIEIFRMRSDD
ncbi:MAG: dihydroneopterin aldolase [Nitrospirae bacterium]|nr:dihydroneopterin aldolase [Nitrospirota bacterium]